MSRKYFAAPTFLAMAVVALGCGKSANQLTYAQAHTIMAEEVAELERLQVSRERTEKEFQANNKNLDEMLDPLGDVEKQIAQLEAQLPLVDQRDAIQLRKSLMENVVNTNVPLKELLTEARKESKGRFAGSIIETGNEAFFSRLEAEDRIRAQCRA